MDSEWKQAVRLGDLVALRRLLAMGSNINALDEHSQTALMIAARDGQSDVVSFLIEHGALVNRTAKYGLSALMLAVVSGHIATVRILADAGADLTIRGTGAPGFAGKTALDLAIAQGRLDIAALLQREA